MRRESKTKYGILGMLSDKPMSGYDIKKNFEEYIDKFWSESYGQIYPIAKELVADGLATCTAECVSGKRSRNVYTITDKGMAALKEWLARPTAPQKERLEILLKLMCGACSPAETNIKLVQHFKDEWVSNLESYRQIEQVLRAGCDDPKKLSYWMMLVNCALNIASAYIAWSDETISALELIKDGENAEEQH